MQQLCAYFVVYVCVNTVHGVFVAPDNGKDTSDNKHHLLTHCSKEDQACVHGICISNSGFCDCFDGWTGILCDTTVSTVSDGTLDTRTKHSEQASSLESQIPESIPQEEGHSFRQDKHVTESLQHAHISENRNDEPLASYIKTKDKAESVKEDEQSRHVCRGYKRRNLRERMCLPGLICTFGTCSSTSHDDHVTFECTCDPGAIGLFCEHKCCLDCGDRGTCVLYANGTEFCDCNVNYHGDKCELSKAGQLSSSLHRKIPLMVIVGLSIISVLLLMAVLFLLLILRDRGCLALMAIPTKCKQTNDNIDARGSVSSSMLVYYPGGDSLSTVTSINPSMNHQHPSDLDHFSNIQTATHSTKETCNDTSPWALAINETGNDNPTGECKKDDGNDYFIMIPGTTEADHDYSTIPCESEAVNDYATKPHESESGNAYSTISYKGKTDDDNSYRVNEAESAFSTLPVKIDAGSDTPEYTCIKETDIDCSMLPCKYEADYVNPYFKNEGYKDYSTLPCKNETCKDNPEGVKEADNDCSMVPRKNEAGNDNSDCTNKCANEADRDNPKCTIEVDSDNPECENEADRDNPECANESDSDNQERENEADRDNPECANESDSDNQERENEADRDNT